MLFTQSISRIVASIATCSIIFSQLPAYAEVNISADQILETTNKATQTALRTSAQIDKETLLACGTCGCELTSVVAAEESTIKRRDKSLLTDSIWGNLILEMAYQRDKEIEKLAKRLGITNVATMAGLLAISGGTIAQGITAIGTLNPATGHLDSYAPGIIGLSLGSATLLTFGTRIYFGHKYGKKMKARQLAIKSEIEEILHHLEYSEAKCPDMHKQLAALIGDRASGEFLQLWQSSHQLASTNNNTVSMLDKSIRAKILR